MLKILMNKHLANNMISVSRIILLIRLVRVARLLEPKIEPNVLARKIEK